MIMTITTLPVMVMQSHADEEAVIIVVVIFIAAAAAAAALLLCFTVVCSVQIRQKSKSAEQIEVLAWQVLTFFSCGIYVCFIALTDSCSFTPLRAQRQESRLNMSS